MIPNIKKCDNGPKSLEIINSLIDAFNNFNPDTFTCEDLDTCEVIINLQNITTSLDENINALTFDFATHINNYINPHLTTLEQTRSQNNSISGDINANNNTIINLKDAVNAQEPITKIQFDSYVSAVGGQRGDIDCSLNPNYPASNKGDRWEVTVAGKIGGVLGIDVQVYDEIVCKITSVSGDQATVGSNFYVVQGNLERATETVAGYIQLATDLETQGGTEGTKAITSLKLENWRVSKQLQSSQTLNIIPSPTPSIDVSTYDITFVNITALNSAITSMSSGLIGSPANFARMILRIKDDGTARAINWGASFTGTLLPSTTVINQTAHIGCYWDSGVSKWRCVAYETQA